MNINSALTKNYEMNSLADPANTNPISPGLKRQLYFIPEKPLLRPCTVYPLRDRGPNFFNFNAQHVTCNPQRDAVFARIFVLLPMLQSQQYLPARQFLPLQTPHFNAKTFANFHTFTNLFERRYTTFCKLLTPLYHVLQRCRTFPDSQSPFLAQK